MKLYLIKKTIRDKGLDLCMWVIRKINAKRLHNLANDYDGGLFEVTITIKRFGKQVCTPIEQVMSLREAELITPGTRRDVGLFLPELWSLEDVTANVE